MGAGEVGRELGDAGGPLLVGALSPAGLAVGIAALAGAVALAALSARRAGSIWGSTRAPSAMKIVAAIPLLVMPLPP